MSPDEMYRDEALSVLDNNSVIGAQRQVYVDMLYQTLLHVSTVAHGQDDELDRSIEQFLHELDVTPIAELTDQLQSIKNACCTFEKQRDADNSAALASMLELLRQFHSLQLSQGLVERIKNLEDGLYQRLANYRDYPEALIDIAQLQREALDQATMPSTTLWQRLRGGKGLRTDSAQRASQDLQSLDHRPIKLGEGEHNGEMPNHMNDNASRRELLDDGAVDDINYQELVQGIEFTLTALVERIESSDIVNHKISLIRARIAEGIDWHTLAITLEDLKDILLLRRLQLDEEFSHFVQGLNEELSLIKSKANYLKSENQGRDDTARTFSLEIRSKCKRLGELVSTTNSITDLKTGISAQLHGIHLAMAGFDKGLNEHSSRTAESGSEAFSPISSTVDQLISRIKVLETESHRTEALLLKEQHEATHDELTGLANRESYNLRAFHELKRFQRYSNPLTLAVCRINAFQDINNDYGYQAGNKILRAFAKILVERLREVDFVARYGGEMFVVLLPETCEKKAFVVLEKVCIELVETEFRLVDKPVAISASVGLTEYRNDDTVETAFERAQKALSETKNTCGNCCKIA